LRTLPRNYRRRTLAVALCLSPVAVLAASIIYGATCGTGLTWGLAPVLVAALLAVLNLHLSFTRPLLYRRKHGSMAGYHFVSGVPLVGTALILAGVLPCFGDVVTASAGLGALVVDTLSPPWFLVTTWSDSSLWDG
jgi:hypothetical protein